MYEQLRTTTYKKSKNVNVKGTTDIKVQIPVNLREKTLSDKFIKRRH